MRLAQARARTLRYLHRHGARATIERKIGEAWTEIASDVPVMVHMYTPGPGGIDPWAATSDQSQSSRLSFPHDADVQLGDRVQLTSAQGSVPQLMTIAAESYSSVNVTRDVVGTVEEIAVERYVVTIERYNADSGEYDVIWTGDAQAVTTNVGERPVQQQGAVGVSRNGTLIISPVPAAQIVEGDWILGVPFAQGAQITTVRAIVGDRLELAFRYNTGG